MTAVHIIWMLAAVFTYHVLRNPKEDMSMWNVFKMLLVPAWLLLAKLKLAFRFAAGAAAFVLESPFGI